MNNQEKCKPMSDFAKLRASAECGESATGPASPLEEEMARLRRTQGALSDVVARLQQRLCDVLTPIEDADNAPKGNGRAVGELLSPMALSLHVMANQEESTIAVVQDLLDRLQVG